MPYLGITLISSNSLWLKFKYEHRRYRLCITIKCIIHNMQFLLFLPNITLMLDKWSYSTLSNSKTHTYILCSQWVKYLKHKPYHTHFHKIQPAIFKMSENIEISTRIWFKDTGEGFKQHVSVLTELPVGQWGSRATLK